MAGILIMTTNSLTTISREDCQCAVNFTCAESAHSMESMVWTDPTIVGCENPAHPSNSMANSQVLSNQRFNPFGASDAKYSAEVQKSTPIIETQSIAQSAIAERAVIFMDSKGVIDCVSDGEPFVLGSGSILAVRDADGSIHRTFMGRSKKYAGSVDQVLALLGTQER